MLSTCRRPKNATIPYSNETPTQTREAILDRCPQQWRTTLCAAALLGNSPPLFSTLADVSERSLASYETNPKLPISVRPRLTEALRLLQALLDILPAEDLRGWLTQPNPGFQDESPLALIKNGERDRIWAMIHQTQIGAYS